MSSRTIATAGEDGCVRLWDARSAAPVWTTCPAEQLSSEQQGAGKWIARLAVSEGGWLACVGGAASTVWHAPSRLLAAVLPTKTPTRAVTFTRDGVRHLLVRDSHAHAAGDGRVRRFSLPLDNERAAECSCTDEHCFGSDADCRGDQRRSPGRGALSPSLTPQPLLAAGNACHLDVFLNPNYQSTRLLA